MRELTQPFVQLWTWVEVNWGFPGKVLLILVVLMLVLAAVTWYGNRK